MMSGFRVSFACTILFTWLILTKSFVYAAPSDVECLKSVKASLDDPLGYLNSSWDFKNEPQGFICKFVGIECWSENENRVFGIQLHGMGLRGKFPLGIGGCSSLTALNISSNHIFGEIPSNISELLPFVTSLDLSSNRLSGQIPAALANCSFLGVLKLDNNQLTGTIPPQIGWLQRIRIFTVTNNRLAGPVPRFVNVPIPASSYANNSGLCGDPLPPC